MVGQAALPIGRGTGTAVGLGAPVGTGKFPGGEPEPTGKGGVTPVDSGLEMLMGDAAAKAVRPARRMAVAYILRIVDVLFEVEGVVGVVGVYDWFVGSDSCVDGRSGVLKAG